MKLQTKIVSIVLFLSIVLLGKQHIQSVQPPPAKKFLKSSSIQDKLQSKFPATTDSATQNDPLIVLTLMVKDEEHVIIQTLKPYIEGGIDAVLLFDTGSTDNTMSVAEQYMKEKKVRFYIVQEPFVDFATSRNRGLELAREKFPHAGFLIMPDAEWYLHNGEELIKFCKERLAAAEKDKSLDCDSYLLRIMSPQLDFYTQRLIRANRVVRFVGVVHETLDHVTQTVVPGNVYFELGSTKLGYEKSRKRWERDKELLLKHHLENPEDPRSAFYLAQTYDCLGELEKAYTYYTVRKNMPGWCEENFMAVYRLAQVTDRLQAQKNPKFSWDEALGYYLQAFDMRPCRAEPLIKVAEHYLSHGQHELAYIFVRRAAEIRYPEQDMLFVEKEAYDYTRHDVLGQCAWYVGSFDLGESAIRSALKIHPLHQHLKNNLAFYENRKKPAQATA